MEQSEEKQIVEKIKQKHLDWSLGAISFTESSFLPILVDPFLVAMTLTRPKNWVRYIMIAGVASVFGGPFAYLLGALFFDLLGAKLVAMYRLEETFHKTVAAVDQNAFYFTFIGAFTPVPYKIIALVAGFMKINVFLFILASIVGRFARFAIVGYVTRRFGSQALAIFKRRYGTISIIVFAAICIYLYFTYIK